VRSERAGGLDGSCCSVSGVYVGYGETPGKAESDPFPKHVLQLALACLKGGGRCPHSVDAWNLAKERAIGENLVPRIVHSLLDVGSEHLQVPVQISFSVGSLVLFVDSAYFRLDSSPLFIRLFDFG